MKGGQREEEDARREGGRVGVQWWAMWGEEVG